MSSSRDQSLLNRAHKKLEKENFLALVLATQRYIYANFLRPHVLTHSIIIEYNEIDSPYKVSIFDRVVPRFTRENDTPDYESAEIDAIRTHCTEGDRVIIIGAGRGITPTIAAKIAGEKAKVSAFEASVSRIARARKTIEYNGASDKVDLHHKIVAKAEDVAGQIDNASTISPEELPDCDYLEVDCEGAEEQILEQMSISPRIISVETHETKGVSHTKIVDLIEDRGYSIIKETDKTDNHDGIRHLVAVSEG